MPNETTETRKVMKYLNGLPNCYAIKIHGSSFITSGTPDIDCCYKSFTIKIEMKYGKNKASDKQKIELSKWRQAGALCAICYSLKEVKILMSGVKRMTSPMPPACAI